MNATAMMSRSTFVRGAGLVAATTALSTPIAFAGESSEPAMTGMPQLYCATVPSIKGDMTVATVIADGAIAAVQVTNHQDTPGIADVAIDDVTARIVAQQNVDVDTTAGATITSMAIISGVIDCLEQAGLDVSSFSKGTDAVATADKADAGQEDWDLVIVGSGFAGISAAIEAKRLGIERVLVLEKEAMTGGSSRVIGGCMSIFGGSAFNEEAGQDCTKEEFVEPCLAGGIDRTNDDYKRELLGNVYDACGDLFTYYHDHGFPINSQDWYRDYNLGGRVVCMNAFGYSDHTYETGHTPLLESLVGMATELGAEIRVNAAVTGLVADGTTVSGVQVEDLTTTYVVNAGKVILACGGFQWNQEYMEKYNTSFAGVIPFAAAGDTGDAITLTEPLDVPVIGAGGAAGWPAVNSALGWYGPLADLARTAPVVLDADGMLLGSGAMDADVLCNTPDGHGYSLYDSTGAHRDRCVDAYEAGILKKFDSIEEISEAWGIDPIAIETAFGTNGLSVPPFFGVVTTPCNIITFPGPQVDTKCRVVNADGQTIENLYAVGACVFGNLFEDTADDPGLGNWIGTFSSSTICCCMGAIAAGDAAEALA